MIKSTLNTDSSKSISYPCVMISHSGVVVLMGEPAHGTVIKEIGNYVVGYYSEGWCMEDFNLYNGTVTIENQ